MNTYHQANKVRWEAAAANWKAMHDRRGSWKVVHQSPEIVFSEFELQYLQNLSGRKAIVLGSGDNLAVFALAGLGAMVTSVDISENQLRVAADRAKVLGLDIDFVQADVTDLSALPTDHFDVVYTGGHVAVWVSDLFLYYREAVRVLKKGGLFIVNEYHPFRRIWKEGVPHLKIGYDYYHPGPYEYSYNDEIIHPKKGDYTQYEFHWTISDYINAVLKSGCQLIDSTEIGIHSAGWEDVPLEGLPEYFLLVGQKK